MSYSDDNSQIFSTKQDQSFSSTEQLHDKKQTESSSTQQSLSLLQDQPEETSVSNSKQLKAVKLEEENEITITVEPGDNTIKICSVSSLEEEPNESNFSDVKEEKEVDSSLEPLELEKLGEVSPNDNGIEIGPPVLERISSIEFNNVDLTNSTEVIDSSDMKNLSLASDLKEESNKQDSIINMGSVLSEEASNSRGDTSVNKELSSSDEVPNSTSDVNELPVIENGLTSKINNINKLGSGSISSKSVPKARKSFNSKVVRSKNIPKARKSFFSKKSQLNKKNIGKTGLTLGLRQIEATLGIQEKSLSNLDARTLDKLILSQASNKKSKKTFSSNEQTEIISNKLPTSEKTLLNNISGDINMNTTQTVTTLKQNRPRAKVGRPRKKRKVSVKELKRLRRIKQQADFPEQQINCDETINAGDSLNGDLNGDINPINSCTEKKSPSVLEKIRNDSDMKNSNDNGIKKALTNGSVRNVDASKKNIPTKKRSGNILDYFGASAPVKVKSEPINDDKSYVVSDAELSQPDDCSSISTDATLEFEYVGDPNGTTDIQSSPRRKKTRKRRNTRWLNGIYAPVHKKRKYAEKVITTYS